MLQSTIPAYLYRQYAGDDDIASLVQAYNAGVQYYIDWFNDVGLPYYPGLSGSLLNWVALGLYGQERLALASPLPTSIGPLDTAPLNTETLNYYLPATQTSYVLTDDAFQRILTWNFYKGDGKRFSMLWIKRRIMRFLLGVNGVAPDPAAPGFVIGTENTQAISVTVASHVITVEIDQVLLSSLVQITPGILEIFQLAFEAGQAGPLELPAQYESYVCDIVQNLTAMASPVAAIGGDATTQTAGPTNVAVLGGSGSYTFSWSWASGGSGITIVPSGSPSGISASFTATGMTAGDTYTGVAQCLVTDTITTDTTTCNVSISIACYAALSAAASPTSVSVTGASGTETTGTCTVIPSGGSGSYRFSWAWLTGGAGISINDGTSAATAFNATGLMPGTTLSGTAQCTVTDTVTLDTVQVNCSVAIDRVTGVAASVFPITQSISGAATSQTTGTSTVVPSGGSGSYTYVWTWQSGGAGLGINSPSSQASTFSGTGMTPGTTYSGIAQCVAYDGYGQASNAATVYVSITCTNITYAGTLVAGLYVEGDFDFIGYYPGEAGSLTPGTDYYGNTIDGLAYVISDGPPYLFITILGGVPSNYFKNLYIDGTAYPVSDATFDGGTWTWSVGDPFSPGSTYDIMIDYE